MQSTGRHISVPPFRRRLGACHLDAGLFRHWPYRRRQLFRCWEKYWRVGCTN
uniref:Uncharacterized protein n=1 Tax=Romanomermis culicivorax TaxID=13658 RepID=A0A915HGG4_ROMCU